MAANCGGDAESAMSFTEKNTWVYGLVSLGSFGAYVAIILSRARDIPLTQVAYGGPMLGAIGVSIATSIIGSIVVAAMSPREAGQKDERDSAIHRYGEVIGYYVLSAGVVGALALTLADFERFWIGNAIYLAFVLAALVSTSVKLVAYRRGLHPW